MVNKVPDIDTSMLNGPEKSPNFEKTYSFNRTRSGELTGKRQSVSYQFRIQSRSQLSSRLNLLTGKGELSLWSKGGQLIKHSRTPGVEVEKIRATLQAGVYRLQIFNQARNAEYKLQILAEASPKSRTENASRVASLFASASSTVTPTPIQLTDNAQASYSLQVSDSTLAWLGTGVASSGDVYTFDGSIVNRLTSTNVSEYGLQVSGSNVVWTAYDGDITTDLGDTEVYLYDGFQVRNLTNNGTDDSVPSISGNNVVWSSYDGNDYEVLLFNGTTTRQLTSNSFDETSLKISGSNITWGSYDGNDYEVFLFDGTTTRQLTNNSFDDVPSRISGSKVTWDSYDGNDYEIFLFDGTSTRQLTNNSVDDSILSLSDENLFWRTGSVVFSYDGTTTREIVDVGSGSGEYKLSSSSVVWRANDKLFQFDGISTRQIDELSANYTYASFNPQLVGSNVVWEKVSAEGSHIYLFDGSTTYKLTNEGYNTSPQVSGSKVYWIGNSEIFYIDLNQSANSSLGGSLFSSGLNTYLSKISTAFSNQVLKSKIPLFGDQLNSSPASQFIGQIRRKIQSSFQNAETFSEEAIQQALFNALGTGGLRVLRDLNGDGSISLDDVQVTNFDGNVEFRINLGQSLSFTSALAKDLGLPGLKLSLGGDAPVKVDFGLNLKFGYKINGNDPSNFTFYANTSDSNELSFGLNVSGINPNTGKFGFLPVKASGAQTALTGDFAIDIKDSSDNDSELSISELRSLGDSLVQAQLTGGSNIRLSLTTDIPLLPAISTQLQVDWGLNTANVTPNQSLGIVPKVSFNNTRLDMGTFMGNFLKPLLQKVNGVTAPISSITSSLNKPIPFLKTLLKKDVSLLDLADILSESNPRNKFDTSYIRAADRLITLAKNVPEVNNTFLSLGTLNLGIIDVRSPSFNLASINPTQNKSVLRYIGQKTSSTENFINSLQQSKTSAGKFELPILTDPNEAFKLLLSRTDANLFSYKMPTLSAAVTGAQTIPIVGPVGIRIQGTIGAAINLKFGFDSSGLDDYFRSNRIIDIFENGFYLDSGTAPLSISAGVDIGPAVDILLARVFASGGILGTVDFKWLDDKDPKDLNKVRLDEISSNFGTLDMFVPSGRIDAKLKAEAFVLGLPPYAQEFATFNIVNINGSLPQFKGSTKGDIPLLADILDLAKPIRDAISRLGIEAAKKIFGARNGQAVVDGLAKFDANVLQKSGLTSLVGVTPLAGLNLLIQYGPDAVKVFQNADIKAELQNLAKYAGKNAKAAEEAASKIVKKTDSYIADAKKSISNPREVIQNAGEKAGDFVEGLAKKAPW